MSRRRGLHVGARQGLAAAEQEDAKFGKKGRRHYWLSLSRLGSFCCSRSCCTGGGREGACERARYHAGMSGDERERERKRRFWMKRLKWASAILFPLVTYFGMYAAMVEPQPTMPLFPASELYVPDRLGRTGEPQMLLRNFFAPAHWIDRKVRPRTWGLVIELPDGSEVRFVD